MPTILSLILKNQLFHWRKTGVVLLLIAFLVLVMLFSFTMVLRINSLAVSSLSAYETDLVLQKKGDLKAENIKPRGLTIPFSLPVFQRGAVMKKLTDVEEIEGISTALTLWQLDPSGNTNTFVALDTEEPLIGLRKTESLLILGQFFAGNNAREIVLERHFAGLYKYKIGKPFQLSDKEFTIVGIIDFKEKSNLNNAVAFLPYRTALSLIGEREEVANQLFLKLTRADKLNEVSLSIEKAVPWSSLTSQDSLLKNLSGLNQIIVKFGWVFLLVVIPITVLVTMLVLKLYRLDFAYQQNILRTIGWSGRHLLVWRSVETSVLLVSSIILAAVIFILIFSLALGEFGLNLHLVEKLG